MSIDHKLLDILCCPATHLPLRVMPSAQLALLNASVEAGSLRFCDDKPVTEPLEQALVTEDGRLAYPIRDDIPLLLEEYGIVIAQADQS